MKVTILGTNGFLSRAIAVYCNGKGYPVNMYGLGEPTGHSYDSFHKVNLMTEELDYSDLIKSDIIVYAIGAGIQSNLKEGNDLIYNLNVTAPVKICNALKTAGYKGCFITFGSVFEMGDPFRLIPYTINAIRNNEPLHFTAGDQTRQYIYVGEVPAMIDLAYDKQLPSGIYNIQGKDTLTVREIVTAIHKHFGKDVPGDCFGSAKRADVGMKYLALDGTKLKNAI